MGEKLTKKKKKLRKLKLRIYIYIPLTPILALLSRADDNPMWIGSGFRDWIRLGYIWILALAGPSSLCDHDINRTGSLLTPPCPNTSKGGEKTGWGEWEKERTKQWKTIRDDPDSLPIAALKFIWIPIFPKWVFFVSQKACTCIFLCEHMHVSMCVGKCVFTAWVSFATRRMFHFWFQFSFPFFPLLFP